MRLGEKKEEEEGLYNVFFKPIGTCDGTRGWDRRRKVPSMSGPGAADSGRRRIPSSDTLDIPCLTAAGDKELEIPERKNKT